MSPIRPSFSVISLVCYKSKASLKQSISISIRKHFYPRFALIVRLATVRGVRLPHRRWRKSRSLLSSPSPLSLALSLSLSRIRSGWFVAEVPLYLGLVLFQHRVLSGARANGRERGTRRARGGYYAVPPARARVGDGAPRSKARRPRHRHYSAHAIIVGHGRALSLSISPRMPPRRRCRPLFPRDACSPHDRDACAP